MGHPARRAGQRGQVIQWTNAGHHTILVQGVLSYGRIAAVVGLAPGRATGANCAVWTRDGVAGRGRGSQGWGGRQFGQDSERAVRAERFAALLAETLYALQLGHKELAQALGVPPGTVDSWTRGADPKLPGRPTWPRCARCSMPAGRGWVTPWPPPPVAPGPTRPPAHGRPARRRAAAGPRRGPPRFRPRPSRPPPARRCRRPATCPWP